MPSAAANRVREPLRERGKRTRDALIAAGARDFSERGYAGATTKSIAARAGAAAGTFYQYFVDKDALLRDIAAQRQARIAEEALALLDVPASPRAAVPDAEVIGRLGRMAQVVLRAHRDDPGLHAVLTERRHADPDLDGILGRAERALCRRVADLLARWRYQGDREATAFVLFAMVEGAAHAHVLGQAMVSDERMVRALSQALRKVIE